MYYVHSMGFVLVLLNLIQYSVENMRTRKPTDYLDATITKSNTFYFRIFILFVCIVSVSILYQWQYSKNGSNMNQNDKMQESKIRKKQETATNELKRIGYSIFFELKYIVSIYNVDPDKFLKYTLIRLLINSIRFANEKQNRNKLRQTYFEIYWRNNEK